MSTEIILHPNHVLDRVLRALENLGLDKRGRNKKLSADTGYSEPQISAILSGKEPVNARFIKSISSVYSISEEWLKCGDGKMFIEVVAPLAIAEKIGNGYGPEVKLMADYLEVKMKGKTPEERLRIVEEIMEDVRSKYK